VYVRGICTSKEPRSGSMHTTNHGTAAYGMYPRGVALPEVVCALNRGGFDNRDICMVLSPAHPDAESLSDSEMFHRTRIDQAMSARTIQWFSKFGAVVIPTVGCFVRSEIFLNALVSEPPAPSLSRGSRILLGLGFAREDARRLGHLLCDFGTLVYVSCPHGTETRSAIEVLKDAGAREAASLGQNASPNAA